MPVLTPRQARAAGGTALEQLARPTGTRGCHRPAPRPPRKNYGPVARRARTRRDLGVLIQRPPQSRWALAGGVAGRAALIGLAHGHVHPGVAKHLARG